MAFIFISSIVGRNWLKLDRHYSRKAKFLLTKFALSPRVIILSPPNIYYYSYGHERKVSVKSL